MSAPPVPVTTVEALYHVVAVVMFVVVCPFRVIVPLIELAGVEMALPLTFNTMPVGVADIVPTDVPPKVIVPVLLFADRVLLPLVTKTNA